MVLVEKVGTGGGYCSRGTEKKKFNQELLV